MNDALYFPIHRAKAGEIAGVGHPSPRTRTRVRPAFEVQKQREDRRGAALRLPFEEFSASDKVEQAINGSLRALRLEPPSVDLFLDFETLALLPAESRTAPGMASVLVDVLREYGESGFRNIVACGSSVPDRVNKDFDGSSLRVERTEIAAWQSLIESYSESFPWHQTLIDTQSDYLSS